MMSQEIRPQPKKKREVNRSYVDWIKTQPCVGRMRESHYCNTLPDAHHVRPRSVGGSDFETLPLCRRAHDYFHNVGPWAASNYYGIVDLDALIHEHNARYQAEVKPRPKKQREVKTVKTFAQCPNRCKSLHPIKGQRFFCTKKREYVSID